MHEHEARLEKLREQRVETPQGRQGRSGCPAARSPGGPVRSGELVDPARGPRGRLPAGPRRARRRTAPRRAGPVTVARSAVPRRPARGADRDRRAERRGQDDAAAHDRGRPAGARRVDHLRPQRVARLPRPAARRRDPRARRSSTRSSRRSRSRPARRAATSPGSCSAATTCSRRSGCCRAASGRGSSSRCSGILPSNLLLLDEPTNHLDIAAREAIEAFLAEAPATILVVSHDRRLLETICERLWVVDDGLAVPFDGGYRAWRAAVADGWTVEAEAAPAGEPRQAGAGSRGDGAASSRRPGGRRGRRHRRRRRRGRRRGRGAPPRSARSCRRRPTGAGARRSTASCRGSASARASSSWRWACPSVAGQLRRDAPGHERARGRRAGARRGRGRLARARGAGAVTATVTAEPGVAPCRIGITGPIGCGKSQVARWLAELGRGGRSTRTTWRGPSPRPGSRPTTPSSGASGAAVTAPDGTLDRAALGADRVRRPGGAPRARGDRPSRGPAADPGRDRRGRRRRRAGRRHRGDQARRGRARGAVRRGLAGDLRRRDASGSGSSRGARHPTTRIAGSRLRPGSPSASRRPRRA